MSAALGESTCGGECTNARNVAGSCGVCRETTARTSGSSSLRLKTPLIKSLGHNHDAGERRNLVIQLVSAPYGHASSSDGPPDSPRLSSEGPSCFRQLLSRKAWIQTRLHRGRL